MRYMLIPAMLVGCMTAGPALAHPGHLAEVAGHGHWIGAAAAGAAIAIALWAGLKARGKPEAEADPDDSPDEAPQEA